MKTIGLLGGMSWESTQTYYQLINRGVNARAGGLSSAQLVLYSLDFSVIEKHQHDDNWAETARILAAAAQAVERAGADFLLIGTNTMHKVADQVAEAITIPLLHIADTTAARLQAEGIKRVGLLGTAFTMEQAFYRERLEQQGIEVLIPEKSAREQVHRIIYQELCQGMLLPDSRQIYLGIIDALAEAGAQGVILGCTEIGLLVQQADTSTPLFDTTVLHAEAAVNRALAP